MHIRFRVVAVLVVSLLAVVFHTGYAAQTAQTEKTSDAPIMDARALDMLKAMSDTLEQAATIRFTSVSMVPVKGPHGIWINLLGSSRVIKEGKDKLFAETRGDFFPYDFYYNGITVIRYAPTTNVYAEKAAPATVDELIASAYKEEGRSFPYADILVASPYETLTADLVNAVYVGTSMIGTVKTEHLVFTNKTVEWQIWIGAEDKLPRLVNATYLDDVSEPSYTVEFKNWELNTPVPADTFTFNNASKAAKIDFRNPHDQGDKGGHL